MHVMIKALMYANYIRLASSSLSLDHLAYLDVEADLQIAMHTQQAVGTGPKDGCMS